MADTKLDTKEELKDWSESAVPRASLELQRADLDVATFAARVAAATVGTAARLTEQARLDAASAWYTRCYINWQEAKLTLSDRVKVAPAPNPVP